jgi:hypothetical protein
MAALIGVLLVGLGCVALLVAVVSRCGAYLGRAVVLFCVGGLAFCAESPGDSLRVSWRGKCSDRLVNARRERDALYRSLRTDVLPLIERCSRDLRQTSPALPENEAATARQHALAVLAEAEARRREQEQAIAELDAAIGIMERGQALTRVKPAERGSAMARVTLFDVCPTTNAVSEQ